MTNIFITHVLAQKSENLSTAKVIFILELTNFHIFHFHFVCPSFIARSLFFAVEADGGGGGGSLLIFNFLEPFHCEMHNAAKCRETRDTNKWLNGGPLIVDPIQLT